MIIAILEKNLFHNSEKIRRKESRMASILKSQPSLGQRFGQSP